jgi:hypothetical protein
VDFKLKIRRFKMINYNKLLVVIVFLLIFTGNLFAQRPDYTYELGKYNILQYRANVRTEPTRNSNVIAILSLHDEIEIIENSWIEEEINNVNGYWYKIKYGNIVGYTFGGNIAARKLITDIDNNGINDYFYFRFSGRLYGGDWGEVKPGTDVIIYINNEIIGTNVLSIKEGKRSPYEYCEFGEYDGYVLIGLIFPERHQSEDKDVFRVTANGRIEYIGTFYDLFRRGIIGFFQDEWWD